MSQILYVEDDEIHARAVVMLASCEGWDVDVVSTASDALTAAVTDRPALVLIDWNLPGGMSGIELCRELRQRAFNGAILFVTGRTLMTRRAAHWKLRRVHVRGA